MATFWMAAFGGSTAKRHKLWSNCEELLEEVVRRGCVIDLLVSEKTGDLEKEQLVMKNIWSLYNSHYGLQVAGWTRLPYSPCLGPKMDWSENTRTKMGKNAVLEFPPN